MENELFLDVVSHPNRQFLGHCVETSQLLMTMSKGLTKEKAVKRSTSKWSLSIREAVTILPVKSAWHLHYSAITARPAE